MQTRLHLVAARVIISRHYSLCSLYLPPSEAVRYEDLEDLIEQLQPPIVLVGDFNIRHPMWEDTSTSPNVNIVIDLITNDCFFFSSYKGFVGSGRLWTCLHFQTFLSRLWTCLVFPFLPSFSVKLS